MAACRFATRYDPSKRVSDWLCGILFKKIADLHRRRGRRIKRGCLVDVASADPTMELEVREVQSVLQETLSRLPPTNRQLLRMYFLEQMTAESIARRYGKKPSTVRSQIQRSIAKLRKKLPRDLTLALFGAWPISRLPGQSRLLRGATRAVVDSAKLGAHVGALQAKLLTFGVAGLSIGVCVVLAFSRGSRVAAPMGAAVANVPSPGFEPDLLIGEKLDSARLSAEPTVEDEADRVQSARAWIRLVDASTNAGVPFSTFGVELVATESPSAPHTLFESIRTSSTDANGVAWLNPRPRDRFRLRYNEDVVSDPLELAGDSGRTVFVDEAHLLVGIVRDEFGAVVADAEICSALTMASPDPVLLATTDRSGCFALSIIQGRRSVLWARLKGKACSEELVVTPSQTQQAIELVVHPADLSLRGTVWTNAGRPAEGVRVVMHPKDRKTRLPTSSTWSRPGGAFLADGLVRGEYSLVVLAKDGSHAYREVTVPYEGGSLEVEMDSGCAVSGRLGAGFGRPWSDYVVLAMPTAKFWLARFFARFADVGGDGSFELAGVPRGPILFRVLERATARVCSTETFDINDFAVVIPEPDEHKSDLDIGPWILSILHRPSGEGW